MMCKMLMIGETGGGGCVYMGTLCTIFTTFLYISMYFLKKHNLKQTHRTPVRESALLWHREGVEDSTFSGGRGGGRGTPSKALERCWCHFKRSYSAFSDLSSCQCGDGFRV